MKIRESLYQGDNVPFSVASEMEDYAGRIVTINKACEDSYDGKNTNHFDGYKYFLIEDGQKYSWSSPMFDLSYNFKFKSNESRLCSKEAPFGGDSDRNSSSIRSRFNKARVVVQPLGYQEIIGRG